MRTENGTIFIYTKEFAKDLQAQDFSLCNNGEIIKHSKNIIDLIEVGDYVNGYKVSLTDRDVEKFVQCDYYVKDGLKRDFHYRFYKNSIYSVVTKQQFESIEYKI